MSKEDTLYFYDLETSGIKPTEDRIMQFAGQRTTLAMEPIGEPDNILIKLTDDCLPDPYAILVTGITPQQTLQDGISEKEFVDYFINRIAEPHTVLLGYNTLRFDNEFMRYTLYRNFYDPYEWSYSNGRSVWDLLDMVRMTRALRPEGIEWPVSAEGKPINKLELLSSINKLEHTNAHDALSDVNASIQLAKLLQSKQPKLFNYLFSMRTKQAVQRLITEGEPFVYTSGRYKSEWLHTTVAVMIAEHPEYPANKALVYDLRYDPTEFIHLSQNDLHERAQYTKDEALTRLPIKTITYNKGPAVAPLSVIDEKSQERLQLQKKIIQKNLTTLRSDPTFIERVKKVFSDTEDKRQSSFVVDALDVDARLYDGFFNAADKKRITLVHRQSPDTLADFHPEFDDDRLPRLLLLYKARQFPSTLSEDEHLQWQAYRKQLLLSGGVSSRLAKYAMLVQELSASVKNEKETTILQDLVLWAESIAPIEDYE